MQYFLVHIIWYSGSHWYGFLIPSLFNDYCLHLHVSLISNAHVLCVIPVGIILWSMYTSITCTPLPCGSLITSGSRWPRKPCKRLFARFSGQRFPWFSSIKIKIIQEYTSACWLLQYKMYLRLSCTNYVSAKIVFEPHWVWVRPIQLLPRSALDYSLNLLQPHKSQWTTESKGLSARVFIRPKDLPQDVKDQQA